jgi:CDP-diacylglycerol---glycerol-3-phosphate 3-phosphatidyltransferase
LNLPNSITLIRILLIPLLAFILLSSVPNHMVIAAVLFVIIAATDYVDGYLARKLKEVTTLGKFLDPLADKIMVITVLLCLVALNIISVIPVMIVVIRDLTVDGLRMVAGSSGRIIAADMLGKYKAVLLDLAIILLILGVPYSVWVLWAGVIFAVVSGINYFYKNWEVMNG